MKKLFPLLLITTLFSQNKEVIVERHSNGVKKSIIVYEGEGSNEKLIRKLGFYKNGILQFSTDWKDGKRNGNVIVNYENGELGFKGKYLNDISDGNMVFYYTDGKIRFKFKIKFTIEKTEVDEWINEIEDDKERNTIKGIIDTDSSVVYLMSDIKIYDTNGKREETKLENEVYDKTYKVTTNEKEIVDMLFDLRKKDNKIFFKSWIK